MKTKTNSTLKKIVAVFCLLLLAKITMAQNPVWALPPNYWPIGSTFPYTLPTGSGVSTDVNSYPYYTLPANITTWNPVGPLSFDGSNFVNNCAGDAVGPQNMYADASGTPLFSVVNGMVYNTNGYLITQLLNSQSYVNIMSGGVSSPITQPQIAEGWAETCIVPVPGKCTQYYIFTAADASFNNTLQGWLTTGGAACFGASGGGHIGYYPYFALIDVEQTNPNVLGQLGKNITATTFPSLVSSGATIADLLALPNTVEGSTSTPAINNTCGLYGDIHYACTRIITPTTGAIYRLLFVSSGSSISVYKITSSGITFVTNAALGSLGSGGPNAPFGNTNAGYNIAELEVWDGNALTGTGDIEIALTGTNFNVGVSCPGPISLGFMSFNVGTSAFDYSAFVAALNGIRGIEFSPDGNSVYVVSSGALESFNYSSSPTSYPVTLPSGTNVGDFSNSQIEVGTDGNLYLIGQSGTSAPRFAKITNPNNPTSGTAGILVDNVLSLPNYQLSTKATAWNAYQSTYITCGGQVNSIFFLPDQIDYETYGSQFDLTCNDNPACEACCLFYTPFDTYTYTAGTALPNWSGTKNGTTQTWQPNTSVSSSNNPIALSTNLTSIVTIEGELRIPAGKTVYIKDMTLEFSNIASLIIEAGGKLILQGCTLTVANACGLPLMWPGVEVWGNPLLGHTDANQGHILIEDDALGNHSLIENAYVGVELGYNPFITHTSNLTTLPTLPTTANTGGGIFVATNATFKNNQISLQLDDYLSPSAFNPNIATNCSFLWTSALLDPTVNPIYMVGSHNQIHGIAFLGCGFSAQYNPYYNLYPGINSLNSFIEVNQTSTLIESAIDNFSYGIKAVDAGSSATVYTQYTKFNNNLVGIYLGEVNYATITNSLFNIDNNCPFAGGKTSGIYIDNSTGFNVQDNLFETDPLTTGSNFTYGVLVNNSGNTVNIIYRNEFTKLYKGSQAQFVNYIPFSGSLSSPNPVGLVYYCNVFEPNSISKADIYIPYSGSPSTSYGTTCLSTPCLQAGIAFAQGVGVTATPPNQATADNQFSHTLGGSDFYIEPGPSPSYYTDKVVYSFYCAGLFSSCPVPTTSGSVYQPYVNLIIQRFGSDAFPETVPACSTSYGTGGYGGRLATIKLADSYKTSYDSLLKLIDGGKTDSLVAKINTDAAPKSLYNKLLKDVPYLSDTVLITLINSNFSATDIINVLEACAPLNQKVYAVYQASKIYTTTVKIAEGTSPVNGLYGKISNDFTDRQLLLDMAIRSCLSGDSIDYNKAASLIKKKANDLPARYQVLAAIATQDSATADSALAIVRGQEGQSNFVQLNTAVLQNLSATPQQLMSNAAVLSTVQTIAVDSSDRQAYLQANILLQTVAVSNYSLLYQENSSDSSSSNSGARKAQPQVTSSNAATALLASTLINSPNPFKESTVVKAVIVENTQNAYIVITDMVGNEIARYPVQQGENNITVNAGSLDQAMMFCTLVVDGVKIKTNKMVLIR